MPTSYIARFGDERRLADVLARFAHSLGLALWLGGLVAIGAVVAPTAFHVARTYPLLSGNHVAQAAVAGGIVGGSLRIFNWLCVFSLALMLAADLVALKARSRVGAAGLAVTLILALSLGYQMLLLFPAMDAAQRANDMALFDSLHARYYAASVYLQLPLLLASALLAAVRQGEPQIGR
jgi:uncharacterized membrane protein